MTFIMIQRYSFSLAVPS